MECRKGWRAGKGISLWRGRKLCHEFSEAYAWPFGEGTCRPGDLPIQLKVAQNQGREYEGHTERGKHGKTPGSDKGGDLFNVNSTKNNYWKLMGNYMAIIC